MEVYITELKKKHILVKARGMFLLKMAYGRINSKQIVDRLNMEFIGRIVM